MTEKCIAKLLKAHVGKDWGMTNKLVHSIASSLCQNYYRGLFTPFDTAAALRVMAPASDIRPVVTIWNVGQHFVCIYCCGDYVLYLDSFGFPCFNPHIKKFLAGLKRNVFYNQQQIQSASSKHCGLYAILFSLYYDKLTRKAKLSFGTDCEKNDDLCMMYLHKLMHK